MDNGHWIYDKEFDPEEWFGFIYRIIDKSTGQHYIGKKQFWSITRRKVKGRKNRKKTIKETKWREYTSSSTHVNAAIEERSKDDFIFIIESLHETKASLYYAEVEKQVIEDVLRKTLDNGDKMYYNRQIGSVKFIPPVLTEREELMSLNRSLSKDYAETFLDDSTRKLLVESHGFRQI